MTNSLTHWSQKLRVWRAATSLCYRAHASNYIILNVQCLFIRLFCNFSSVGQENRVVLVSHFVTFKNLAGVLSDVTVYNVYHGYSASAGAVYKLRKI